MTILFNIFSHQGSANQTQVKMPPRTDQKGYHQEYTQELTEAGEDKEEKDLSCIDGGMQMSATTCKSV